MRSSIGGPTQLRGTWGLGVGPDVLVGLCVERSLEMVVGILGIIKAGGAYVPLTRPAIAPRFHAGDDQGASPADPGSPADRAGGAGPAHRLTGFGLGRASRPKRDEARQRRDPHRTSAT